MPIRTIPKNYRNITGIAPHNQSIGKAAYESSLERDFLTLLAFNRDVLRFEVQPIQIEWFDTAGKRHIYTPDILVHFHNQIIVYEVKYRSDLQQNWHTLKPKFQAALRFCKQQNWRFKLVTEVEIHTDYLKNARFLLPYRERGLWGEHAEQHMNLLADAMKQLKTATPKSLISQVFQDEDNQAKILPVLWYLLATEQIGVDFNQKITMNSKIWYKK